MTKEKKERIIRKKEKEMNKTRENLIDRMIKIYGFENELVLDFALFCEKWEDSEWNDKVLTILVESHEANPCF